MAARLHAPRPVAERDGLRRPGRAHRLHDDPRPRGDRLDVGLPAIQRHLVGHEPPDHRGMAPEPPRDLRREPRLLRHHPHVPVQVAPIPPRRVPVLPRHMTHDERRDRPHPLFDVRVEEISEPVQYRVIELLRSRHKVRPVTERPRDVASVLGQCLEFLADNRCVVAGPHARPAGPRPEVRAQPRSHRPGLHHLPGSASTDYERARAVLPRNSSSPRGVSTSIAPSSPSIAASSRRAAETPYAWMSRVIDVSGGCTTCEISESSQPTIETSSGTDRPMCWTTPRPV